MTREIDDRRLFIKDQLYEFYKNKKLSEDDWKTTIMWCMRNVSDDILKEIIDMANNALS